MESLNIKHLYASFIQGYLLIISVHREIFLWISNYIYNLEIQIRNALPCYTAHTKTHTRTHAHTHPPTHIDAYAHHL